MDTFTVPEIAAEFGEVDYMRLTDLLTAAAAIVGDGQGNELGSRSEFERGVAALIVEATPNLNSDDMDSVVRAIHATARDLA